LPILVQIKADEEVINSRIRNRINKMIYEEKGLKECFDVFTKLGVAEEKLDFEKGIL
jgi:hypothetical protein